MFKPQNISQAQIIWPAYLVPMMGIFINWNILFNIWFWLNWGLIRNLRKKLIIAGTAGTVPWDTNPTESRHLWDASPGTGTEICRDSRDWDWNPWDSPGRLESRDSGPGTESPWDSLDCPMPVPDPNIQNWETLKLKNRNPKMENKETLK